jgi:hypothetical protein
MIYAMHHSVHREDDCTSPRLMTAARQALAVIVVATLARLALAAALGLGIDESYAFAVPRPFSLSYLDHPPLVFWIVGAVRSVTTEPVVLRAPFILRFAGTAWLSYRTTAHLFGERAAFFTTCVINLAPVFAVSSGGWILPDGPLLFGLALATTAIVRIRFGTEQAHVSTHVLLGAGIGIALLSKYHAVLFVAGLLLWCATDVRARELARSPRASNRANWHLIAMQARTGWLSNRLPSLFLAGDPSLDLLDWTSVRAGLTAAGLGQAREAEGTSWIECAKLAYALAPTTAVRCANTDGRHFLWLPPVAGAANDVVIVRRATASAPTAGHALIPVMRGGRSAFVVEAFRRENVPTPERAPGR